jgi:hypothetical protein
VPTLYGIPIPPGAQQVEVRPVFGRGQRRLMFRGPVERDGVFITEDDIADHVAADSAFWAYVDSQVASKVLQVPATGVWAFKVSVCFTDQHGAPATLDPNSGLTSRVAAEPWEFWRGASKESEDKNALGAVSVALADLAGKQATASAALVQAAAGMAKEIAIEVSKQVQQPLVEMARLVAEHAKRSEERADGLAVDLFKHMAQKPQQGSASSIGLVRDLLGIAREAKTFLN